MSPSRRTTRSHAPPPTQRSSTHIEQCKKLVRKMGMIEGLNIDHREKTWMFENIVTKLTKKLTNYQTLVWILNMTIFMRITRLIISSTSWSGPSSGRRRDLCSSDHGKTEHEQHSRERGVSKIIKPHFLLIGTLPLIMAILWLPAFYSNCKPSFHKEHIIATAN